MKLKTTKKAINASGKKVLKVGYCGLQSLLNWIEPFAYSARTEGWACDYYNIDNIIISTGYAPIGNAVDYSLIEEYEKKAEGIRYSDLKWDDRKTELEKLTLEFLEKAVK